MNLEEYKESLEVLKKEFELKKNALIRDYIKSSAKYAIGDILEDKFGGKIMKVTVIRYQLDRYDIPMHCYFGRLLKKKLEPTKKEESYTIYGEDRCILVRKALGTLIKEKE